MLVAAACGGGSGTKTTPATEPATTTLRVYFLRNGEVQPVARTVPKTKAVAAAALRELVKGPTTQEQRDLHLSTGISNGGFHDLAVEHGAALLLFPTGHFSHAGLAQLIYTLTQFSNVHEVKFGTQLVRFTRADFEDLTPLILVESPLPFEIVHSPLRATGTANTFEATFDYDLVGPDGELLAHHFVTATSGSGTRGTFDFTAPFTVSHSGQGKLVVYELSAKDGSRIHQVAIPLQLAP